jgi:hypothetical protein
MGLGCYKLCAAIADERETWQAREKYTLHPGTFTTKRMTPRWVQGVRVMQRLLDEQKTFADQEHKRKETRQ